MNTNRRLFLTAAAAMSFAGIMPGHAAESGAPHPMRRKDRELTKEEAIEIIKHTPHAVMATVGADGMPYAAPISPVYFEDNIYFHTAAAEGLRFKNLQHNPKASICFVGRAETAADELPGEFSVNYASAIVFGTMSRITDEKEKRRIATAIAERQVPQAGAEAIKKYYDAGNKGIWVWKMTVTGITGKARNKQGYFNRIKAK